MCDKQRLETVSCSVLQAFAHANNIWTRLQEQNPEQIPDVTPSDAATNYVNEYFNLIDELKILRETPMSIWQAFAGSGAIRGSAHYRAFHFAEIVAIVMRDCLCLEDDSHPNTKERPTTADMRTTVGKEVAPLLPRLIEQLGRLQFQSHKILNDAILDERDVASCYVPSPTKSGELSQFTQLNDYPRTHRGHNQFIEWVCREVCNQADLMKSYDPQFEKSYPSVVRNIYWQEALTRLREIPMLSAEHPTENAATPFAIPVANVERILRKELIPTTVK